MNASIRAMDFNRVLGLVLLFATCAAQAANEQTPEPVNPAIDMNGFLAVAGIAAEHRESRRLSEEQFQAMSAQPNTIILDARSAARFEELHIKGAKNLSFPDFTSSSLESLIPNKQTRILIYCNNNFNDEEQAFPRKMVTASLNLSTYVALYDYGYKNVFELGPLISVPDSILEFAGTLAINQMVAN